MLKDDYIKFRCSSDFKKQVENKAKEINMNTSSYIEMLIRKDMINMMYVFSTEEMTNEQIKAILDNKMAKMIDNTQEIDDDFAYLLSKTDKIVIENSVFNSNMTLNDYIELFDGGEYVAIYDFSELEINKTNVISFLIDNLYKKDEETGKTNADNIYESENPKGKVEELINEFLLVQIDIMIDNIKMNMDTIKRQIKDGSFKWG